MVYSGTTKDKILEVKEIVLKEIKKLKDLKKSDFEEAKETLFGLKQITKEKCDSTMIDLLQEELGGDSRNYYNYEEELGKIKIEDIKKLSEIKGYSFSALLPD